MISSLLHLVDVQPRVYYTLTNFRGEGQGPLAPPSIRQCNRLCITICLKFYQSNILAIILATKAWAPMKLNSAVYAPYERQRKRDVLNTSHYLKNTSPMFEHSFVHGRQTGGVGGVASPPDFWKGGFNHPDFEIIFFKLLK